LSLVFVAQSANTLSSEDHNDSNDNSDDFAGHNLDPAFQKLNKYLFQRPGSRAFSVPAYFPFFTLSMKETPKKVAPTSGQGSSSNKENKK
jgi:hypothetical protein